MNKSQLKTIHLGDTSQIFISYAHADVQFALELKSELEACGYLVWLDTASIPGGDIWLEKIGQAITESFAIVCIISKSASESKWVRREYLYADEQGKEILPVIIDDSACPFYMIDKHAVIYNGDFSESFLSIKRTMDRWVPLADQAVVSQEAWNSTSASVYTDVRLPPSIHALSQRASNTSQDGHVSRNRVTNEQSTGWENAVHNESFYGRVAELQTLKRWALDNQCRVIAILGMGGVGKTSISVALVNQIKASFTHIFWRSLRNAPPFRTVLQDCVQHVSDWQSVDLPENVNDQILLLLEYLRTRRCLIVLSNMEMIMQAGDRSGEYREGYEAYGKLLELVGREEHQSCLLLTSREKPKDIAYLEGATSPIRSYPLKGLKSTDGQKILKEKRLRGAKDVKESLVQRYAGHPLALKLVAQLIRELFDGDIASFIKDGEAVFDDIRDVLDQQFERVSGLEMELIYWLAIEREAVSLDTLQKNMIGPIKRHEMQEVLRSLLRRNLIEANSNIFQLQSVVMEYVTDRFVASIAEEIKSEEFVLFDRHALIKAQAKDYIRESQVRLILTPIVQRLLTSLAIDSIELKCQSILALLHKTPTQQFDYTAGNILNMLLTQGYNLRGYDFAHLPIRQAYLRGQELPDVLFAHAHFIHSVFTDMFGSIYSIAFSPNRELLAMGTSNGDVKLWDALEGTPILNCVGHTDWVRSVAFSPDGHFVASGSSDHTIRLWEVSSGKCLNVLDALGVSLLLQESSSSISSVAFSCDGTNLAIGINDGVWLWNIHTSNRIRTFSGHASWVQTVTFSPDDRLVASGSNDHTIRLWEVSTGECLMLLQGHSNWVRSVAFSADGSLLASGSNDHTIRLWEVSSGKCLMVLQSHTAGVRSVAFSADGSLLASGSNDHTIRLWEVGTGQCLDVLHGHSDWVFAVAFSADGSLLASGGDDRSVRFWETNSRQCIATLQGYSNRVFAAVLDPAGNLIASGSEDFIVRVWDARSGQYLRALEGHNNSVFSVAFSPDGSLLASGSQDRTIRLWDVSTGECLRILQGYGSWAQTVAFSPNGHLLISGSEDSTLSLWDVNTGQCLKVLQGHSAWVRSVAFSPDGHLVASSSDDHTIRLWDVSTGECLRVLQGHNAWVRSVAFSPDGSWLASGSQDRTIRLWDVSTGQCLKILQRGKALTYPVAFCPNGHILANSSNDQTIQLWDINEGLLIRTLQGHSGNVSSIAFSSDGSLLLSGSNDETMRLWNVGTGTCLLTVRNDRPYEHMDITGATGLTEMQREALKVLGAIEKGG